MYPLSFMGKVTFCGQLRLTRVSEDWLVLCVCVVVAGMKAVRANSMCFEFPVIVICSLLTLWFSFLSFFSLI